MALMGIDIGSTGCKCAAFATDGRMLAKEYREYNRSAGSSEFDGQAIWRLLCDIVPRVAGNAGQPISAVSVASVGEAFAPVDSKGNPLHPFMQSTHAGGNKYAREMAESVGDAIRERTGLNPLARYSLAKMMYLNRERPEIFRQAWKFMMLEDFIVFRLCGRAATDYSVATRSAAFDLDAKRYDDEILAVAGLGASRLCDAFPAGTPVGEVLPDIAERFGIPRNALVVLGGHDTIPENLCSGLLSTGIASVGCGTFEGTGVLIPERRGPNPKLLENNFSREPYPIPGLEFVNGVNPNAGNIVKWFRDEFGGAETATAEASGRSAFALLDELAPAESSGLLVIPHLVGSGAPEFNSASRGAIAGLTLATTRGHVYRAFLEGIAYEMALIVEKYRECGMDIAEINATSGGAKSRLWLQIRADILGLPFVPMHSTDTTLAGCAMLAGVASGVYRSLDEAAAFFVKKGERVEPDSARHAHYQEQFRKYRELRALLMDFCSR